MHGLELIHVKREASQIPKLQVFLWVFLVICGSKVHEKKSRNGGETCLPSNVQAICKVLLIAASFLVRWANC